MKRKVLGDHSWLGGGQGKLLKDYELLLRLRTIVAKVRGTRIFQKRSTVGGIHKYSWWNPREPRVAMHERRLASKTARSLGPCVPL